MKNKIIALIISIVATLTIVYIFKIESLIIVLTIGVISGFTGQLITRVK